jgi:vancomycin permeability regulator SanA
MTTHKYKLPKLIRFSVFLILSAIVWIISINSYMISKADEHILLPEDAGSLDNIDCIMVLGCGVHNDTPSPLLADRLQRGVEIFQNSEIPKILMSGDHGKIDYDEVNVMKQYALNCGIDESDIFMDHAGFSTYETMSRAIRVFGADKVIVVTQQYHLYRALYIAKALGIEAYGVDADYRQYSGQLARDVREVLARVKDFGMAIFQPEPTYLGDAIPISGSGIYSHDE